MWEFLGLKSECGGSVCWPNNEIIDRLGLDIAPTPTNKEDPANRIGSVQTLVHTYGAHEFEKEKKLIFGACAEKIFKSRNG